MSELIAPELLVTLKNVATPAAIKAVGALASRIAGSISSAVSKQLKDVALNLSGNFGPHLATTFDRCTKLKTLVSADEPASLLDQYVNLKFKCGEKVFSDYDTIEQIRERKRVIISGTGGGGKTIFTKYLWISFFENPKGQIPIFFELRRLNEVSVDDLLTLIYYTIVQSRSSVPRETFDKGIASGLFIFILDGFDEVAKDKKASVEKQILELAKNNPECPIIVSGRPDETFDAWQAFSNFTVQPLTKQQVVSLVGKLKFDKATKRKFITRINADLYERHTSFLSTPLLATLMLLTFNQYADIPEKIHLFYEQAFDTLFARHDAMKESFKRDMHSKLSIDVFKKYFSYFCLVSYFDSKIEFTNAEIKRYINRGLKIENVKLNTDQFLKDLQESICVIQRDGLNLVFTHRTFQEFFAAYCLARLSKKHFRPIVEKIANRYSDNVVQMLYDMNDDLLETEYLLPTLRNLLSEFEGASGDFLYRYAGSGSISIRYFRDDELPRVSHEDDAVLRSLLRQLFAKEHKSISDRYPRYRRKDRIAMGPFFKKLAKEMPDVGGFKLDVLIDRSGSCRVSYTKGGSIVMADAPWFRSSGFVDYAQDSMAFLDRLRDRFVVKAAMRDTTLEKIFGIDEDDGALGQSLAE